MTDLWVAPPSLDERESAWRWIDIDLSNEEEKLTWLYCGYGNELGYGEQGTWDVE